MTGRICGRIVKGQAERHIGCRLDLQNIDGSLSRNAEQRFPSVSAGKEKSEIKTLFDVGSDPLVIGGFTDRFQRFQRL